MKIIQLSFIVLIKVTQLLKICFIVSLFDVAKRGRGSLKKFVTFFLHQYGEIFTVVVHFCWLFCLLFVHDDLDECLVDWFVISLVIGYRFIGWLSGWLVLQASWLVGCKLIDCLSGRSVGWLLGWFDGFSSFFTFFITFVISKI